MIKPYRPILAIVLVISLAFLSCQKISNDNGDLVARVYNRYLTKNELAKLFPVSLMENDSLRVVEAYIDRWVRDQLILYQAEKEIKDKTEINQLVEKYRSSLVLLQYENMIIENEMDTVISQNEMQDYYQLYKDQYILSSPILKGIIFKIPKDDETDNKIKTLKKLKDKELSQWCIENNKFCITNPDNWYSLSDILGLLPNALAEKGSWKKNTRYETDFEEIKYMLYIEEFYDTKEIPPISYVANQAKQVILHQRRQNLIDQYNNEIYESHKKSTNVEIY
jgi:hypothetical protein